MKLTIFPSDEGDCLLVTGKDGKRILADGGKHHSFDESVAPALSALGTGKGNKKIDVVYVSHIDADHIEGILKLMDDAVAWAIHDHHVKKKNKNHKAPRVPRPPEISEIWHNGFGDVLKNIAGPIEDQLAANARLLSGVASSSPLRAAVDEHQNLAASVRQAVQLGRRIADGVLGIPLNRPAGGKLMMVRPKSKAIIRVGGMRVRVLAPFREDIEDLRKEWKDWLLATKNMKDIAAIRARAKKQQDDLTSASEAALFISPLRTEGDVFAAELVASMDAPQDLAMKGDPLKKKIGKRSIVTTPNLASLMLHVTEGGKTLLLTGDGHADEVLKGLKHHGLHSAAGGIHVDVLKVQHHGAEYNMTDEFAKAVTADHYIFCGNGFSENPEQVVIQRLFDSRLGPADKISPNPQVGRPFTFWFNCSSKVPQKSAKQKKHMAAVEKLVAGLKKKSKKRMTVNFLGPGDGALTISV